MTSQVIGTRQGFLFSVDVREDLESAIGSRSAEEVISILKETGLENTPLPNGEMPLHYAIRKRNPDFVEELIEEIPFDLDLKDHQGFTPIDHAQITHNREMITRVLSHKIGTGFNQAEKKTLSKEEIEIVQKISQDVASIRSRKSISKLHKAAAEGNLQKLKLLIDGRRPDELDSHGMTPLHYAALKGKKEALQWLLEQGCKIDLVTPDRLSLLHFAVIGRNPEIVQMILNTKKLDPNCADTAGRTPLHYAITDEDLNLSQALIGAGANPSLHCGGHTHSISPLETLFHLAKTRGEKQDSLQISKFQTHLFVGIAASWASFYATGNGYTALCLLSILAKISCFKMIYENLKSFKAKFLFAAFYLTNYIPALNLFYRTWNTYRVGKEAIKGFIGCCKNSSLETYRPLRNAIIHITNGIYLRKEFMDGMEYADTLGKVANRTFKMSQKIATVCQHTFRLLSDLTDEI